MERAGIYCEADFILAQVYGEKSFSKLKIY